MHNMPDVCLHVGLLGPTICGRAWCNNSNWLVEGGQAVPVNAPHSAIPASQTLDTVIMTMVEFPMGAVDFFFFCP